MIKNLKVGKCTRSKCVGEFSAGEKIIRGVGKNGCGNKN